MRKKLCIRPCVPLKKYLQSVCKIFTFIQKTQFTYKLVINIQCPYRKLTSLLKESENLVIDMSSNIELF